MLEGYWYRMSRSPKPIPSVARPTPDYTDRAYWQGTIKMSLSKFFVLCVLHQKPMHGYAVVQAVERTTKGCCSPTEGTVYPVLNEFEAGGYLSSRSEVVQGRARKVYTLTEKGRDAFKTAVAAWLEATACILASKAAADALVRSEKKSTCQCG
jgi:PadR family transcriptional regulator, regulatory protein PadR